MKNNTSVQLVIFDFDGVIVDSEILVNEILSQEITKLGWELSVKEALSLFSGMNARSVDRLIETKLSCSLLTHFREKIHLRINDEIDQKLEPIKFIEPLLETIQNKCIASNGEMYRILRSLEITKLSGHFKQAEIFNSQMVEKGKPDPSLFLFAAEKMGVNPQNCLVIEDSIVGIQAAHAAKMKVIGFTGGTHAKDHSYLQKVEQMNPHFITNDMREILHYLQQIQMVAM